MNKERNIFERREVFKPYEYPEVDDYVKAIQRTYWVHDEVAAELNEDVQDYHSKLGDNDRFIISTILRTFADTETKVLDDLWGVIGKYFKKPEFQILGTTLAENEGRHADAYFRINELLDLTDFAPYSEDPVLSQKFENLLDNSLNVDSFDPNNLDDIRRLAKGIAIFSCFTERVSLFSQFMVLRSFSANKRSMLKGIANIVDWSARDEIIHSLAGIWLFNQIKEEYPQIWTDDFKSEIYDAANTIMKIEKDVLAQIFVNGDLPNLKESDLIEYMKNRVNESLELIDLKSIFTVDAESIKATAWFDKGLTTLQQVDFLDSRSADYTKKLVSFTSDTVKVSREEMRNIVKENLKMNR